MKKILGIFGLAFLGFWFMALILNSETDPEDIKTDSYALIYAERAIEGILKAPSTAEFGGIRNADIRRDGDTFFVRSFVDSQNSFGAMIRSHYEVKVTFEGEKIKTSVLSFD